MNGDHVCFKPRGIIYTDTPGQTIVMPPRKLKILGHEYDLQYIDHLARDRGNGGGCCVPAALKIEIDPNLPPTRQGENLLHEIFEALKYHLQLDTPHEKLSACSEGLFAVMQDNRGLFIEKIIGRRNGA